MNAAILTKNHITASVTIFLSLSLTIILSVIFIVLESARLVSLRTYFTDVSYLSMDSLFGSYCNELWQDYGVLAINTSDVDVEDKLSSYISDNISNTSLIDIFDANYNMLKGKLRLIDSKSPIYLTDNSGDIFAGQVMAYMKYASINNASKLFEGFFSEDKIEIYDFLDTDYSPNKETLSKYDVEHPKDTSECMDITTTDANDYHDSLAETITHHLQYNTLLLLVDDPKSISNVAIDKTTLPSVTCLSDEAVFIAEGYLEVPSTYTYEKILMEEYITSHFGCYTNAHPDSKLKYELEYVLMGQNSDDKNLLSTASHLVILRASFNSLFILSDAAKYTAANDLANKCVGWMNIPPLTLITKYSIISLWATAEGFMDVRDLLSGKKVPLIKDDSTWTLSLGDAASLSKDTISKNSGNKGYSYLEYIKALLIAENELALRYRAMDLIQLNIRHKYNDSFSLRKCLCAINVDMEYEANNVFLNLSRFLPAKTNSIFNININYSYN